MEYELESFIIGRNVQTPDPWADLESRPSLRVPRIPNILVQGTILGVLLQDAPRGVGLQQDLFSCSPGNTSKQASRPGICKNKPVEAPSNG